MYTLKYHKSLNPEKWKKYSKGQQILMVANELNRAGNWIRKNKTDEVILAYERAFELIDLTIEDDRWKKHTKELLRFREVLGELYCQPQKNEQQNEKIMKALILLNPESYNLMNG